MKILIFDDREKAVVFARRVHRFLTDHRPRYTAERWSRPNKSDNANRWAVKVPYDARRWTKKFIERVEDDGFIRIANKLHLNWRNIEEL